MKQYQPHSSSIGGIAANLLACLIYVAFGIFGGFWTIILAVIIVASEKNSYLVKFAVAQSFFIMLFYNIARGIVNGLAGSFSFSWFGFGFIRGLINAGGSIIWGLASAVLILLYVALWIYCAVKAYRWQQVELPLIGGIACGVANAFGAAAYNGEGDVPPQAQPGARHSQQQSSPYYPPQNNGGQPDYSQPQQPYNQPGVPYTGQPQQQAPQYTQPAGQQQPYTQPTPPNGSPYAPQQPAHDPNSQVPPDMRDK